MKTGTILLSLSFLFSKIIGLVRDNLLASGFGATAGTAGIFNLDTYYAAFRLPDLLFNLLSYGILSSAFVPIFVEILKKENRQAAFQFSNQILRTIGLAILGLSVVLFILAPFAIRILVPGFSGADFQTTVNLTRLMLITPFFFTIGSIAGGIQNSLHKFLGLALAPIFYNAGIVAGIVFFAPSMGVYGVALGVIIGAFLNMLVQLPGIFSEGFKFSLPTKWWSGRVKEMITLSIPRIFGMSVTQLSLIIGTMIASTLATGSITVINFANNLESLPVGLVGIAVAIVSFGRLSLHAAEGKTDEFVKEVSTNIRRILFLLIPLAAGMFLLRFQAVRLFLGRGKFNWTDTTLTANTLGIFLSGLIFGGLVFLLARAFYAMKDTKTPVIIGIVSVAANILTALILTKIFPLGTYGLAAATAIADIFNGALLILFLRKRLKRPILEIGEIGKFIFSAAVMSILVILTLLLFDKIFVSVDTYMELIVQSVAAVSLGAVAYFGTCRILKCKDAHFP